MIDKQPIDLVKERNRQMTRQQHALERIEQLIQRLPSGMASHYLIRSVTDAVRIGLGKS